MIVGTACRGSVYTSI